MYFSRTCHPHPPHCTVIPRYLFARASEILNTMERQQKSLKHLPRFNQDQLHDPGQRLYGLGGWTSQS